MGNPAYRETHMSSGTISGKFKKFHVVQVVVESNGTTYIGLWPGPGAGGGGNNAGYETEEEAVKHAKAAMSKQHTPQQTVSYAVVSVIKLVEVESRPVTVREFDCR